MDTSAPGTGDAARPVVALRTVRASDLPIFFAHQSDPVAAALADFPARDRASFMAHWSALMADPAVLCRTVLAGGAVAGNVVAFDHEGRREIGYWIGREFWGRGVATRAVRAFLRVEPTRPLYGAVAAGNGASIMVLQRCGFTRRGEQDGYVMLVRSH